MDQTWKWSNVDKGKDILYDGMKVTHKGEGYDYNWSLIRTEQCITEEMDHVYFEVTVIDQYQWGNITIGFSKASPDTKDGEEPGKFNGSFGYKNWGTINVNGHTLKEVEKFGTGDTIGCGVHRMIVNETTFLRFYFTKNGEKIEVSGYVEGSEYCPTIGMYQNGVVKCNFGEKAFKFNVQGMYILTFFNLHKL